MAAVVGVGRNAVQRWLRWYREGGLAAVRSHRRGGPGKPSYLTPEQEQQLVAEAAMGVFATAAAVRDWLEAQFGVVYTVGSLYTLLPRLGIRLKTPRPRHTQADPQAQEAWKRGAPRTPEGGRVAGGAGARVGRRNARGAARPSAQGVGPARGGGLPGGANWLEVPLCGGRPQSPDGAVVVGVATDYEGRGDGPHPGVWAQEPAIDGWVWDGAGGHRSEDMQAVDAPRVVQPPYAPELNPVERFFRELRRALEGRVYPTLQAKQAALEPILQAWQADPERVKKLCGWSWIQEALEALPAALFHFR